MRKELQLLVIIIAGCTSYTAAQDLLYLDGAGATPNLAIQNGGVVYVQGGFVANAGNCKMDISGELHLTDGASTTSSHFTDNNAAGCIVAGGAGSVFLESGLLQNVSAANTTFYDLYIKNSSANTNGVRMLTDISVSNQLIFQDGLMYANTKTLYISNTAANAITYAAPNNSQYTQSWLAAFYPSGKLNREMVNSNSIYAFPVGSTTQSQLLEVTPTAISGITRFSASWENPVTGTSPVSITECGTAYMLVNSGGEWHLRPANGGSYGTGSFSGGQMTISGYNLAAFSGLIDNQFALLTRPEGSVSAAAWTIPSPSCTSLAPYNTAGRTVAADYATRINLTAWNDNLSQVGMGTTSIPLPIELLSLTAWNAGAVNELSWITASEINSDKLEIERSSDGKQFEWLGTEKAAGTSYQPLQYYFTDYHPLQGLAYYRLKLLDLDQSFNYSNVVAVERQTAFTASMSIFPNPGSGDLTLQIESEHEEDAAVQLTDALGRLLSSTTITIHSGINQYLLQTVQLSASVYFIHVIDSRNKISGAFKFLKTE